MKTGMHLRILTPKQILVDETDVRELYVYTSEGMLAIMPGHAPIVTNLSVGVITYTKMVISGILRSSGGVMRVNDAGDVLILADIAEDASRIDLERARKSLARAEARLSSESSNIDKERANAAKSRALARIEAVERYNEIFLKKQ